MQQMLLQYTLNNLAIFVCFTFCPCSWTIAFFQINC